MQAETEAETKITHPDVWVNGIRYVPASATHPTTFTWKEQGTMLILRTAKNETLGYVHKHPKRAFTVGFRVMGKQYPFPKKFQTQPAAKAALIRFWTGIVRTEL